MDEIAELRRTIEKLAAVNERRASLIQYRDRQMVQALAAGSTWADVQRVAGIGPRGVALAIKRTAAG